jgi:hypothetical protein
VGTLFEHPKDLADKIHRLLFDFRCGFWPFYGNDRLTTALVAMTYNNNTSSGFGGTSVGTDLRYCLSSIKVIGT